MTMAADVQSNKNQNHALKLPSQPVNFTNYKYSVYEDEMKTVEMFEPSKTTVPGHKFFQIAANVSTPMSQYNTVKCI
jgi:hypothetical protein